MTRRVQETIAGWLDKKAATAAAGGDVEAWKSGMLEYFDGLELDNGVSTLQLATAKWFCNGTVMLPEDQDKCTSAVKTALYRRVDPLSFARPMEIIERFGEYEERVGMSPEDVPTFVLEQEKDGLAIYSVENGSEEECYENCRKFCISHFGEDSLPWCLTRDIAYWRHYSAYGKKIALYNGRPVAFCANDSRHITWWDRQDSSHSEIPVLRRIPGDRLHRVGTALFNPETLERSGDWTNIHTGNRINGEYKVWSSMQNEQPDYIYVYKNKEVIEGIISENVTEIGDNAFSGCSSLKEIKILENVTKIGSRAFSGCSSLTKIKIPENVTEIGDNAFSGCSSLTVIHIPKGVTKIGFANFSGCSSLKQINIPDRVTEIGEYAFYGCSSLTEIHIPDSVTNIGEFAFCDCSSLIEICISDRVTEIGNYAFDSCSSLTEIHIPDGVTKIGDFVFYGC